MEDFIGFNINSNIVLSPINKNKKSKSYIDYINELEFEKNTNEMRWDDTSKNLTKIPGGLFGFVHNYNKIEFCLVISIGSLNHRRETWRKNIGQNSRNVIILSPIIKTINWKDWLSIGGHKKVQGTTQLKTNKNQIFKFITKDLINFDYSLETGEFIIKQKDKL